MMCDQEETASFDEDDQLEDFNNIAEKIQRAKQRDPGMFMSAWEKDEQDIDAWTEKEIASDPLKRFITAAEKGEANLVRSYLNDPESCPKDITKEQLLNGTDGDGYTALHRAAYNGNVDVIETLITAGAQIDPCSRDGWTPFHSACFWNQTASVQLLVEAGANYKLLTKSGQSAFHLSSSNNSTMETMAYLLTLPGCQDFMFSLKNQSGDTASEILRRNTAHSYVTHAFSPITTSLKLSETEISPLLIQ